MMKAIFRVVNRGARLAPVIALFSLGLPFPPIHTSSRVTVATTTQAHTHWDDVENPVSHGHASQAIAERSQIRNLSIHARQHVDHSPPVHKHLTVPHLLSGRGESQVDVGAGPWMSFVATWYSPQGGEGNGLITATGTHVKNGWTVAVDPRVIPLGSLIQVQFADGHTHIYRALDTGGAIKGHRVDIFDASSVACVKNGRQPVQVRVLGQAHLAARSAEKRKSGSKW